MLFFYIYYYMDKSFQISPIYQSYFVVYGVIQFFPFELAKMLQK